MPPASADSEEWSPHPFVHGRSIDRAGADRLGRPRGRVSGLPPGGFILHRRSARVVGGAHETSQVVRRGAGGMGSMAAPSRATVRRGGRGRGPRRVRGIARAYFHGFSSRERDGFMRNLVRAYLAATMVLGLVVLCPGCAEDNEATANIKGQAPTGDYPKSPEEMQAQMKGARGGLKGSGYPGAGK